MIFQNCFKITYDNFEISLVVFMPNITTNHAITYTNSVYNEFSKRERVSQSHDQFLSKAKNQQYLYRFLALF